MLGDRRLERFPTIKKFIIIGFFFLFPILGPLTPEFRTPLGAINSEMIWLFFSSSLLVYVVLVNRHIKKSATFLAIIAYYLFLLANAFFSGYFEKIVKTDISLFFSSALFILLIDNLNFTVNDKNKLITVTKSLIIITLIGSLLQYFVDNSLFVSQNTYYSLSKIDFEGFWRNGSIFDSLTQNQGGMFFIFAMFLILNKKHQDLNVIDYILLFSLLVIGFLTFTRYIIFSHIFLVVLYFLVSSIKSVKTSSAVFVFLFVIFLLGLVYFDDLMKSKFIQVRLFADVSGRTQDPFDFFTQYSKDQNFLVGIGVSSFNLEYFFGNIRRLHAGIWDLIFQAGFIGLSLWFYVLSRIHKKALMIRKYGGSSFYLLVVPVLFLINFTAQLTHFYYFGFLLIYLFMKIELDVRRRSFSETTNQILYTTTVGTGGRG